MSCRGAASTPPYLSLNRVVRGGLRSHPKPTPEWLSVAPVWRETLQSSAYFMLWNFPKDFCRFPKELTRIQWARLGLFL